MLKQEQDYHKKEKPSGTRANVDESLNLFEDGHLVFDNFEHAGDLHEFDESVHLGHLVEAERLNGNPAEEEVEGDYRQQVEQEPTPQVMRSRHLATY
jgi:hypothetical protein